MVLREKLWPMLTWRLGNGEMCTVQAQPWFEGASLMSDLNRQNRLTTVKELVDDETGQWDAGKIIELLGHINCLQIITNVRPPRQDAGTDELIFKPASNGGYSVKKAYDVLKGTGASVDMSLKKVWELIWQKGTIAPRVRLFLWKLMRDALPLAGILASKIHTINPTCATCGLGDEQVQHLLFTCPFSRACWFSSSLNIRSDRIGGSLSQVLTGVIEYLTEEQWTIFANVTWAIWRCRNEVAYGGKQPSIQNFQNYLEVITRETSIATQKSKPGVRMIVNETGTSCSLHDCFVDGSWVYGWQAGIGIVLTKGTELLVYKSKAVEACCPQQAESMALKDAVQTAIQWGNKIMLLSFGLQKACRSHIKCATTS